MSKKNSSVILKNAFKDFEDLSTIYLNFKKKINNLKKKSYLVAISGGPDSLALSALTKAYSLEKKIKFYYVLVDHKIRSNSSKEAKQVKRLLKTRNINLVILTNKTKIKKNIQGQARNIRYEMLLKYSKKNKIKTLITAHNLEDQVETFFIRLSRGSGLTGLSAMKQLSKIDKDVSLFRPFLDIKKEILIKISKTVFGKYFKDPSNNNSKFLRTNIRKLKKPLSKSGINYDQIIKSINNLAASKATLDEYHQKIFKGVTIKLNNEININLKKFNKYNLDIKIRVINDSIKSLKKNYYNPRAYKVINLINQIKMKRFNKSTLGGCVFTKKKDFLSLKSEN